MILASCFTPRSGIRSAFFQLSHTSSTAPLVPEVFRWCRIANMRGMEGVIAECWSKLAGLITFLPDCAKHIPGASLPGLCVQESTRPLAQIKQQKSGFTSYAQHSSKCRWFALNTYYFHPVSRSSTGCDHFAADCSLGFQSREVSWQDLKYQSI